MSKGGVNEYDWTTANPDKVSCIYADNPAIRPEAFAKLNELANHDVPLLNVCGSMDFLLQRNTLPIENNYHELGGRISLMIKEGTAHHPHSLIDARPLAEWIEQNSQPTADNRPQFLGDNFIKSYFYSLKNSYRPLKEEETYATCRGPMFSPCYERYDDKIKSEWGVTGTTVVVPQTVAPGKPWVLRAGSLDRDSAVDLALLAKGYHIVVPPLTAQSGAVKQQWDELYKLLVNNGFSKKPALEGTGAGAGECYAWAIENPDQVACIFGENPVLHSLMSKKPVLENLAPLAKAKIPLWHDCGELDPWLADQTVELEKKYKELGGQITVVAKKGQGHFPDDPADPKQVVEFITSNAQ